MVKEKEKDDLYSGNVAIHVIVDANSMPICACFGVHAPQLKKIIGDLANGNEPAAHKVPFILMGDGMLLGTLSATLSKKAIRARSVPFPRSRSGFGMEDEESEEDQEEEDEGEEEDGEES